MLLALTGTFASGISLLFATMGGSLPPEQAIRNTSAVIVDTGYSSAILPTQTAQAETCYLLEKVDDTCVWEYNGVWIIGECTNPPSIICPRG